jgi:hypothetical protein
MADKEATGSADEADLDALLDGAPGGMCAARRCQTWQPPVRLTAPPLTAEALEGFGDAGQGEVPQEAPPARCRTRTPPSARSPLCAANHPERLLVSPQGLGSAIQQPRCALRAATHTRRRCRTGSACRQAGPQVRPPAEARQCSPAAQRGARAPAASRPGRRCRGGPDCRAVEAAGGAGQRQVALPLLLCGSECLRGVDWLAWYSRTWGRSAGPPGAAHTPQALPPPPADRRCLPPTCHAVEGQGLGDEDGGVPGVAGDLAETLRALSEQMPSFTGGADAGGGEPSPPARAGFGRQRCAGQLAAPAQLAAVSRAPAGGGERHLHQPLISSPPPPPFPRRERRDAGSPG